MNDAPTVRIEVDPPRPGQALAATTSDPQWTRLMTKVTGRDGVVAVHWDVPSTMADRPDRLALLSVDELARMRRLLVAADQERFLAAWSLARRVLGAAVGADPAALRFRRTCALCGHPEHGKPRLAGPGPDFSLSHAGDRVVVAVGTTGRVGIDVECVGRPIDELASRILHPTERGLAGLDLLRVWTRKEAVLKASGVGLVLPMTSFTVAAPAHGARVRDLPAADGYVAAVAELPGPTANQ